MCERQKTKILKVEVESVITKCCYFVMLSEKSSSRYFLCFIQQRKNKEQ